MRDLTKEELALAPDGFNEYGFNRGGSVFFFNRELGIAVIDSADEVLNLSPSHYAFNECKPISKEPFDISKHEWSDDRLSFDGEGFDIEYECFGGHVNGFSTDLLHRKFNKNDAIAIAKHFGLTEGDLK